MKTKRVATMSDGELVARLGELVREERRLTAAVLVHLGEVEARRLFLPAACPSMFVYCTRVLGMSEDQAFTRIRAARAMRRFPLVAAAVAEGRPHLSGVVRLAPHLDEDNVDERVAEASGKSKAEIGVMLARWVPRPDVSERLERVAEQTELMVAPAGQVVPGAAGRVVAGPAGQVVPAPPRRAERTLRVAPLAPERFALQVTIGEATRGKLLRAQALLRHQVPSGDLAEVMDRALDALIEKIEAKRFGKVRAPRAATPPRAPRAKAWQAAPASPRSRYVPREVQRQVVARDGVRCSFVAEDGTRCEETGFLELDHVVPVARGGEASVEGVRVLCRAHNQYEAERILGREVVDAGRAAKAMRGSGARDEGPGQADEGGGEGGQALAHLADARA